MLQAHICNVENELLRTIKSKNLDVNFCSKHDFGKHNTVTVDEAPKLIGLYHKNVIICLTSLSSY